ncbi:MAG: FeoA family protein [Candidatus Thorarchaeota archaeon]
MSEGVPSPQTPIPDREMVLNEVPPGTHCKLVGIKRRRFHGKHGHIIGRQRFGRRRHGRNFGAMRGCRHREIMKRLLDLGITKGCTFQVVQGSEQGPVLIQVRGTRIALGHGLASRVLVEEVR